MILPTATPAGHIKDILADGKLEPHATSMLRLVRASRPSGADLFEAAGLSVEQACDRQAERMMRASAAR